MQTCLHYYSTLCTSSPEYRANWTSFIIVSQCRGFGFVISVHVCFFVCLFLLLNVLPFCWMCTPLKVSAIWTGSHQFQPFIYKKPEIFVFGTFKPKFIHYWDRITSLRQLLWALSFKVSILFLTSKDFSFYQKQKFFQWFIFQTKFYDLYNYNSTHVRNNFHVAKSVNILSWS